MRIKSPVLLWLLAWCCLAALLATTSARGQEPPQAEAIQFANVRSGAGIEFPVVGRIDAGTKYPIIGQHPRFPWLLIQLPDRQAWVFKDVVTVTGSLANVPYTEVILDQPTALPPTSAPLPTLGMTLPPEAATLIGIEQPTALPITLTPSATPFTAAATAEAINFANVRYGPGTDFPAIGTINRGEVYAVTRRHLTLNWIEIAFPQVAGGRGWIARDLVTISGDLNAVEGTTRTDFGFPTLTPTPNMVITAQPPYTATQGVVNQALLQLGEAIYQGLLANDFVPRTGKQASVFILDLSTGQNVSLNPDVAYSGVSLMKVPLLVSYFRKISFAPTADEAQRLAEMIICSENLSSNAILRVLGDGDEYRGARYVTETMQLIGLRNTFLERSFFTGATTPGPTPTEPPFNPPPISADGSFTNVDPSNQTTPADLSWLLAGIYQCARDGSGVLTAALPEIDQLKCLRMARVLRANKIGAMIEAGVPANVPVLHKHGWAAETHGDTAIVLSPGGDYVLTVMLYNRTWLEYDSSFPLIAEISRQVYNTFNPSAPLGASNTQPVPLCSFAFISSQDPSLIADLQASSLPPLK